MGSRRAPDSSLALEWVFGYNGHTARNNVKVTPDGHLVYYVAGVGVIHDVLTGRQLFFTGHSDDITSIAIDIQGRTVATGQVGEDAYITVWETSDCSPLSVIHDAHKQKVSCLAFSHDKQYLASVGGPEDKQELVVWDWIKARRVARAVAYSGKVEEVEWDPKTNMKLVTCGKTHIKFWKLRGNVLQSTIGILGSNNHEDQVTISHMKDGTIVSGSKNGHLLVWEVGRLKNTIKDVHKGGVLATEVFNEGLISGGSDGTISIFDQKLNLITTIPEAPSLVYDKAGPVQSICLFNDMMVVGTQLNEIWLVKTNIRFLKPSHDIKSNVDEEDIELEKEQDEEDPESEVIHTISKNFIKDEDKDEILRQLRRNNPKDPQQEPPKEDSEIEALIDKDEDEEDKFQIGNGIISAICVVQGHGMGEVWGLDTHPSRDIAVTASDDGTVRLWDLEEHRPLTTLKLKDEEDARAVAFNDTGTFIAVGLKFGVFIILDADNLEEQFRISDRRDTRHDLKYSPNGKLLAVASNDGFVDIYLVDEGYMRERTLKGANSFITHLDWTSDSRFIQINSGDGERIIFDVQEEDEDNNQLKENQLPRGSEWATWTCVLGMQVAGLWHKYSDISDINAVDANFYYEVVVTGDDYGHVKLFKYPCIKKGSKSRTSVGHSEDVTNVRWTSDSGHVVSVGGADHAVFLWRFKPSRAMSEAMFDTVTLRAPDEDDDDDPLDTEDEYEGIPEITQDIEEDILKERARLRELRELTGDKTVITGVEVASDSTFMKRCTAEDDDDTLDEIPKYSLKMEHVFGYRSHGCRNNVKWLSTNQVVYHVAGTAVVLDLTTRLQRHYLHHSDDIVSLAIHPGREVVATGQVGKEACIHAWNTSNLRILSYLGKGHTAGVGALSFSSDGTRLASLGMDDYHTVVIWDWMKGYKIATSRGSSNRVYGIQFSSHSNRRLVSYGLRHIRVWTQVGGGLSWRQAKLTNKFKNDTLLCCGVIREEPSGERWIFGTVSGYLLIMEETSITRSSKAHKGPVYSILVVADAVWTSGQDGYICRWDEDVKKCMKVYPVTDMFLSYDVPVGLTISQPGIKALDKIDGKVLLFSTEHSEILFMDDEGKLTFIAQGHGKGELWGLDTHPQLMEAVTVSEDMTLKRWDLEGKLVIGSLNMRKPARSVGFHPSGAVIAVGFKDGSVAIYDYPDLSQRGGAHHRKEKISDVKFSPDGRLLAVASHDSFVDLYVIDTDNDTTNKESSGMRRIGVCKSASSFVTHVTWGVDSRLLQVNTGAGEQLFYEAPHAVRQLIPESTQAKLAWTSPLTCILDATVSGVWEPGMDLTDINALANAHELPLLVTVSDGFGLVNLFNYPCTGKLKVHREYLGHSSHVTNVRWTHDDSMVLTTGGADTALVLWKVKEGNIESPGPIHDQPDEDITVTDLEVADLPGSANDRQLFKPSSKKSGKSKKKPNVRKVKTLTKELPELTMTDALKRLRPVPTFLRDEKIFYLSNNLVGCYLRGEKAIEVAYTEHNNVVTAIAVSPADPIMVASAELSSQLVERSKEEEDLWPWEEQGALIHVWRPSDGAMVTALTGSKNDAVITALSFSPSGRFLASLVDACAVHVFNWIKGVHIASAPLKSDSVITIQHVAETTIAALTPRALLLCDLVGNTLLPTHTHIPPGMFDTKSASFTSMTVNNHGRLFAGCSDGTIMEWSGRVAIRKASPPDFVYNEPHRIVIICGKGVLFAASKPEDHILVHSYSTDKNALNFYSEVKTKPPTDDWKPCTLRLGKSLLVIGSKKGHPFVVLNLQTGIFIIVEPNYDLVKPALLEVDVINTVN